MQCFSSCCVHVRILTSGVLQCAAFLEIVSALFGLVGGGLMATLMQVLGRNHVLGLIYVLPQCQQSTWILPLFLAWSTIEVLFFAWPGYPVL